MTHTPSYLPPPGAETRTCRHCGNECWRSRLNVVGSLYTSGWRDKYGTICEGGLPHAVGAGGKNSRPQEKSAGTAEERQREQGDGEVTVAEMEAERDA